jgi:MFS family permease
VWAVLLSFRVLSAKGPASRESGFDWTGAVLIVLGLSFLFVGVDSITERGWTDAWVLTLIVTSLVVLCFFLLNESKSPFPILRLSLFKKRFFTQSCAASYFAFFAMISAMFLVPFYLQEVLRLPPRGVGLVMTTLPAAMFLVAPLGGWASDKIGSSIPASLGLVLVGVGIILLTGLEAVTPVGYVVLCLSFIGVGMGFFGSPNTNAVLSAVPREQVGTASGLSALMRTSGIGFGIAFSAAVFTFFRNRAAEGLALEGLDSLGKEQTLYLEGIKPVFLLAVVVVGFNVINSLTRGPNPKME